MNDSVLLDLDGARATITLNDPAKHNRLTPQSIATVRQMLAQVATDPAIRVLVVTGAGDRTFCSGFDIGAIGAAGSHEGDRGEAGGGFAEMVDQLEAMRVPTIAALNGSVFGGATDLALACDFRIGVHGMRLFVPPARLGLHYYPSGLRRFVERLGPSVAKRLFLTVEEMDDAALLRIGYVDWLVDRADLPARAAALALRIAELAPLAVQGMKRAIDQIARGTLDEPAVRQAMRDCAVSADLREGLAAHAEKRKPQFRGR